VELLTLLLQFGCLVLELVGERLVIGLLHRSPATH
jgi:hypothetical protein